MGNVEGSPSKHREGQNGGSIFGDRSFTGLSRETNSFYIPYAVVCFFTLALIAGFLNMASMSGSGCPRARELEAPSS